MSRIAHNAINREGQSFNYWTIVKYSHTDKYRKRHYLCKCECGKESIRNVCEIVRGVSKSCGCRNAVNHTIHGMANAKVYNIWQNIKNRCTNPKSDKWKWYGGRGITVCEEWKNSFEAFFSDMGNPTTINHSIDRIDNEDGYYKENCKWSTTKEQANNRRKPTRPLPQPPTERKEQP